MRYSYFDMGSGCPDLVLRWGDWALAWGGEFEPVSGPEDVDRALEKIGAGGKVHELHASTIRLILERRGGMP